MTQLRLNNLMILNVHKEALDGVNLEEVGNEFISIGVEYLVLLQCDNYNYTSSCICVID